MYAGMFSVVVDCINILKSGLSVERIWTLNFSQNICAIFHYCTLLLQIHLGVCDSAKLSEPCWPTVCSKKDKIGMQNIQQYPGPRFKNLLNLFYSHDHTSNSPYSLPYNSYYVSWENLVLDRQILPLIEIFSLFSSLVCLILYWYCKEKFCLGHSRECEG